VDVHAEEGKALAPGEHGDRAAGRNAPRTSTIGLVASLLWSQVPQGERQTRLDEAGEHLLRSGVDVARWPPHRRIPVWDPIEGRVIGGAGAPKVRAAVRWFARHPYFYVHLPTLRRMFGVGAGEEEEEEGHRQGPAASTNENAVEAGDGKGGLNVGAIGGGGLAKVRSGNKTEAGGLYMPR